MRTIAAETQLNLSAARGPSTKDAYAEEEEGRGLRTYLRAVVGLALDSDGALVVRNIHLSSEGGLGSNTTRPLTINHAAVCACRPRVMGASHTLLAQQRAKVVTDLGPLEECCEHRTSLGAVAVDGLLAEHDELHSAHMTPHISR